MGTVVALFYNEAQITSQQIGAHYTVIIIVGGMAGIIPFLPVVIVVPVGVDLIVPIQFLQIGFLGTLFQGIIGNRFFHVRRCSTIVGSMFLFKTEFHPVQRPWVNLYQFGQIQSVRLPVA